jgi:multidrug efflux pump subunit AcrA (membrane-fusion protein)
MANLTSTDAVIIELFDNPLTERTDDRYGRVVNVASVNEDTLIERAIANGFNGNAASMKATYQALKQEALKAIVRGEIVHFGLGYLVLDVEGVFLGDVPVWNPEKHKLVASITATKELHETLKATPVKILGMAPDRAAIAQVTDVVSGKTNEVLTPGGMVNVKGSRIRIEGDEPTVGLFLTNQDTQEVIQIPVTSIGMNDPSKVMFVAPTGLAAGSYLMSIVTQSSGNSKILLNKPRTITFIQILTVE